MIMIADKVQNVALAVGSPTNLILIKIFPASWWGTGQNSWRLRRANFVADICFCYVFHPKGLDSRFGLHRFPSFKNMSFRVTVSMTRCVETSAAQAVNTNTVFVTKRKFLSKNIYITCSPEDLATHCQLLNFGAEIQH